MVLDFNLDEAIKHLRDGSHLNEHVITSLFEKTLELLYAENTLLVLPAPITLVGDVHGQLFDVLELFRIAGDPSETRFLFLGDYVDRGYYSIETFALLCALKLKFPNHIYLLRGNHETRAINEVYGLYNECVKVYGHPGIWSLCNDVFSLLPVSAIVENRIFCTHGGLSPNLSRVEQVCLLPRGGELPRAGPLADLTWSDPDDIDGWKPNTRGAGYLFGQKPTEEFCQNNKLDLVVRAHQLMMAGYEYKWNEKLVTVWSAPNYMYTSGNEAAVMKIDENLNRTITQFKEVSEEQQKIPEPFVMAYFA